MQHIAVPCHHHNLFFFIEHGCFKFNKYQSRSLIVTDKRKKSDIEIRQATKHNNEPNYEETEKQIQTLTSE